jgi:lysophospholipase L1-like esterase
MGMGMGMGMKRILGCFLLAATVLTYGFGLGRYEWPPMSQIRALRETTSPPPVHKAMKAEQRQAARSAHLAQQPVSRLDLVMLGDSITEEGGDWTELLGLPAKNRGVGWDTTADILVRLPTVLDGRPHAVFVLAGINDIRVAHWMVEDTFSNLTSISRQIRASGSIPILQSVLPPALNEPDTAEKVARLNVMLADWSEKNGEAFLDLTAELAPRGRLDESLTYDGVHLNFDGYSRWRRALLPVMDQIAPAPVASRDAITR